MLFIYSISNIIILNLRNVSHFSLPSQCRAPDARAEPLPNPAHSKRDCGISAIVRGGARTNDPRRRAHVSRCRARLAEHGPEDWRIGACVETKGPADRLHFAPGLNET